MTLFSLSVLRPLSFLIYASAVDEPKCNCRISWARPLILACVGTLRTGNQDFYLQSTPVLRTDLRWPFCRTIGLRFHGGALDLYLRTLQKPKMNFIITRMTSVFRFDLERFSTWPLLTNILPLRKNLVLQLLICNFRQNWPPRAALLFWLELYGREKFKDNPIIFDLFSPWRGHFDINSTFYLVPGVLGPR